MNLLKCLKSHNGETSIYIHFTVIETEMSTLTQSEIGIQINGRKWYFILNYSVAASVPATDKISAQIFCHRYTNQKYAWLGIITTRKHVSQKNT